MSENTDFAAQCEAEGIAFVGPTPQQMEQFGFKHAAREIYGHKRHQVRRTFQYR